MNASERIEIADAPDSGDPEAPAAVIGGCPTGAPHYTLRKGEPERPRVPTRIRLSQGGPVPIDGDLDLGGERETRAALSRCAQSANEPYCDRSGPCREWEYEPERG